ncbi:hypothetical protein [Saccharothrix sp. HUAS TT1]|uniref:hypothetical protein n=1 Tax=unclassified Saccharothrix TaxID=2593673 RepID=UPI00345B64D2
MTTIEKIAPTPARVGQGTAIEQSRAMAEVEAAVLIAQRFPRNQQAAIAAMRESCRYPYLAEKAFFSYRRGGSNVTGSSVYLARELARIWGNIDYRVQELLRDDEHGQSEMQAVAWDLQTNTRVSSIFIVPHTRDKDSATVPLTQGRDIYENNANQGAKRVRQAIFSVLPPWFVAEAEKICRETIENGGGVPLPQRVADVIRDYAEYFGVDEERLARQVGRPSERWTAHDVAQLRITGASLKNGELTADEAFPQAQVTAAEIGSTPTPTAKNTAPSPETSGPAPEQPPAQAPADEPAPTPAQLRAAKAEEVAQRRAAARAAEPEHAAVPEPPPAEPVADDAPPADEPPAQEEPVDTRPATRIQVDALTSILDKTFKVTGRQALLDTLSRLVRARVSAVGDLTRYEATELLRYLAELERTQEDPARALDVVLADREVPQPDGGR